MPRFSEGRKITPNKRSGDCECTPLGKTFTGKVIWYVVINPIIFSALYYAVVAPEENFGYKLLYASIISVGLVITRFIFLGTGKGSEIGKVLFKVFLKVLFISLGVSIYLQLLIFDEYKPIVRWESLTREFIVSADAILISILIWILVLVLSIITVRIVTIGGTVDVKFGKAYRNSK